MKLHSRVIGRPFAECTLATKLVRTKDDRKKKTWRRTYAPAIS